MLRLLALNLCRTVASSKALPFAARPLQHAVAFFSNRTLATLVPKPATVNSQRLLQAPVVATVPLLLQQPTRSLTKFSLNKGKRKSVKAVLKRFKRLHWGAWIRTRCGRHKHLFKKSGARRKRLQEHVFTNSTQSWLLDKMVTSFWRRPKYYVDDLYGPYHQRNEFFATKAKSFKV